MNSVNLENFRLFVFAIDFTNEDLKMFIASALPADLKERGAVEVQVSDVGPTREDTVSFFFALPIAGDSPVEERAIDALSAGADLLGMSLPPLKVVEGIPGVEKGVFQIVAAEGA